jgi:hypothetical protein
VIPVFSASLARGATFNIVGPYHTTGVDVRVSNNVENGTSVARGRFPVCVPAVCCVSAAWDEETCILHPNFVFLLAPGITL